MHCSTARCCTELGLTVVNTTNVSCLIYISDMRFIQEAPGVPLLQYVILSVVAVVPFFYC